MILTTIINKAYRVIVTARTVRPARVLLSAAAVLSATLLAACATPGTATSSPCGNVSTMRRACASDSTSLVVPQTTSVGHWSFASTGHRSGRFGGPFVTRCSMYAGSIFHTHDPCGSWRRTPSATSR